MANECLVTNLKGIVDNENLPKYGELTMTVQNLDDLDLCINVQIDYADRDTVSLTGPNVTEVPTTAGDKRYKLPVSTSDYKIKISNYYKIKGFSVSDSSGVNKNPSLTKHICIDDFDKTKYIGFEKGKVSFSNIWPTLGVDVPVSNLVGFKYISISGVNLNTAKNINIEGDIASLANSEIIIANFQDAARKLYGNISSLAVCVNAVSLKFNHNPDFNDGKRVEITGDIASLSPCISFNGDVSFVGTKVSGTLESLVEGQIAAGRQENTNFDYPITLNGDVTFNGEVKELGWLRILFTSTGAQIVSRPNPATIYADYNKTTGVWTYSNLD